MRISDWSSDVCSSDLHLLPQSNRILLIISRRTEHADELRDGCNHCCRITVGLHEDGVGIHRAQFRQAVHMLLNLQHPVLAADAPAQMLRSEEHTSELQSLMRISYAVFCLKKKKTHT